MADDYRELIRKLDLMTRLSSSRPRPITAHQCPDKAQEIRDWLIQHGDSPIVSDEAKLAKIDDLKHEIRKRERYANPLARFASLSVDRHGPVTTVESQQLPEEPDASDQLAEKPPDAMPDESDAGSSQRALKKAKENEIAITCATEILRREFEARANDPDRARSKIIMPNLYEQTIPKADRQWFLLSRFKEKVWKQAHERAGVETPQGRPSEEQ